MGTAVPDVKVLYIAGYSRSGSTLLDCLVGQLPGFFSTGELAYIWTHGLQENRLCGCGSQFQACSFWTDVGEVAFGGWDRVDVDEMLQSQRAVNRHRFIPLLLQPELARRFEAKLARYADVLRSLYGAIATVAGARVIVDSTIDPSYGFLLRRVPGLDLRLVHMVRDSRATAFSWTRLQRRTDRVDAVVYQRRFRPPATAVRWTIYHLLVHLLASRGLPAVLVRYEDLVRAPQPLLRRVAEHVGEDTGELGFVGDGEVELRANHTVAGSLVRLRKGAVPVRLDDEWTREMATNDRRLVTAMSWPLLRNYGYVGPDGAPAGAHDA